MCETFQRAKSGIIEMKLNSDFFQLQTRVEKGDDKKYTCLSWASNIFHFFYVDFFKRMLEAMSKKYILRKRHNQQVIRAEWDTILTQKVCFSLLLMLPKFTHSIKDFRSMFFVVFVPFYFLNIKKFADVINSVQVIWSNYRKFSLLLIFQHTILPRNRIIWECFFTFIYFTKKIIHNINELITAQTRKSDKFWFLVSDTSEYDYRMSCDFFSSFHWKKSHWMVSCVLFSYTFISV